MSVSCRRLQAELKSLIRDPLPGIEFISHKGLYDLVFNMEGIGLYEGLNFQLIFKFPINYPYIPPRIRIYSIYHPNVGIDGYLKYSELEHEWTPLLTIRMLLLTIQVLLNNPEGPSLGMSSNVLARPKAYDLFILDKKMYRDNVIDSYKK